jgi:pilus assembly protein Flp/PilA
MRIGTSPIPPFRREKTMLDKIQFMTLMLFSDLKAKRDDRGATAVEYGLLVALIAAIIVTVVGLVGLDVQRAFQTIETALP